MKDRRQEVFHFCWIVLILLILFFVVGCSRDVNSEELNRENEYRKASETVELLNHLGGGLNGEYGINLEKQELGYRVYLGTTLDKCMESICENYSISMGCSNLISADDVKKALNEDLVENAEILCSSARQSHFLYKLFEWCGSSCKDTAVYNEGSDFERSECEKIIASGNLTNIQVIEIQIGDTEDGKVYSFKFKWQ